MTHSAVRVIALGGELEIGRRDEIAHALALRGDEAAVLVDFSAATYADSTTLATLLELRSRAAAKRIPVALIVANRQFSRLLQYAGLTPLFEIYSERGAALSYLGNEMTT